MKWSVQVVDLHTVLLFGWLVFVNLAAWVWAFALYADHPAVVSTALAMIRIVVCLNWRRGKTLPLGPSPR